MSKPINLKRSTHYSSLMEPNSTHMRAELFNAYIVVEARDYSERFWKFVEDVREWFFKKLYDMSVDIAINGNIKRPGMVYTKWNYDNISGKCIKCNDKKKYHPIYFNFISKTPKDEHTQSAYMSVCRYDIGKTKEQLEHDEIIIDVYIRKLCSYIYNYMKQKEVMFAILDSLICHECNHIADIWSKPYEDGIYDTKNLGYTNITTEFMKKHYLLDIEENKFKTALSEMFTLLSPTEYDSYISGAKRMFRNIPDKTIENIFNKAKMYSGDRKVCKILVELTKIYNFKIKGFKVLSDEFCEYMNNCDYKFPIVFTTLFVELGFQDNFRDEYKKINIPNRFKTFDLAREALIKNNVELSEDELKFIMICYNYWFEKMTSFFCEIFNDMKTILKTKYSLDSVGPVDNYIDGDVVKKIINFLTEQYRYSLDIMRMTYVGQINESKDYLNSIVHGFVSPTERIYDDFFVTDI